MRAVASVAQEIERLADYVLPGRQAAARNEALRQVARRLQRLDACAQRRSSLERRQRQRLLGSTRF
jgi:hypothetical protein